MKNTQAMHLRAHHSTKGSTVNESTTGYYINSLTSRTASNNKINYQKNQSSVPQVVRLQLRPSHAHNQSHYDLSNQIKEKLLSNTSSIQRNQSYITLGNKNKQANIQVLGQTNAGELAKRIQQIAYDLQKHNKRLTMIQSKMLLLSSQKQEMTSKLNTITSGSVLDSQDLKMDILYLKSQLSKMMNKNEAEKRIQSYEVCIRNANLEFKKLLFEETSKTQIKIQRMVRKQSQKLSQQFNTKLKHFQRYFQQFANQNKIQYYQPSQKFASNFNSLLKNPNIKLKFLGKVSLIEQTNRKNPENINQIEYEQWQIQEHTSVYMIDKDGYLLDQNQRYIINNFGQFVKLNYDQISVLMSRKDIW